MGITSKKIGKKLRTFRLKNNKTQEEVAFEAGIDYSFYNQIENGKRNMSVDTLARIIKAIGISMKDIV